VSKNASSDKSGSERRRTRRRPILETFSMFCVVPKKGMHRLPLYDVSDHGIGFDIDLDVEGMEEDQAFSLKLGEPMEVHFYLNQSLYLPLKGKVARIVERNGEAPGQGKIRRIGAEIDPKDPAHAGFAAFLKMLDAITDIAKIA
jgi:hypothetical protein